MDTAGYQVSSNWKLPVTGSGCRLRLSCSLPSLSTQYDKVAQSQAFYQCKIVGINNSCFLEQSSSPADATATVFATLSLNYHFLK